MEFKQKITFALLILVLFFSNFADSKGIIEKIGEKNTVYGRCVNMTFYEETLVTCVQFEITNDCDGVIKIKEKRENFFFVLEITKNKNFFFFLDFNMDCRRHRNLQKSFDSRYTTKNLGSISWMCIVARIGGHQQCRRAFLCASTR